MLDQHFAFSRVKQLIYSAGAERVSNEAVIALNAILTKRGEYIAKRAVEFARVSGRKTVKEAAINLANR